MFNEEDIIQSGIYKEPNDNENKPSLLRRNRELVSASWKVLKKDKELILFPIFSIILNLSLIYYLLDGSGRYFILAVILLYFLVTNISIFFNSAIVAMAKIRIEGGMPNLLDGIKMALAKIDRIIIWSLYSCTIGIILTVIQSHKISEWLGYALEITWSLVTYFVIPIIIINDIGVFDAIKESKNLIKKNWGSAVRGEFSIAGILMLIPIVFGIAILISATNDYETLTGILVFSGITLFACGIILTSALSAIFNTALYMYIKDKKLIYYFNQDKLEKYLKKQ